METNTKLMTVGQIAEQLGMSLHQVSYAIDKLMLKPTERVGIIRLFSGSHVEAIGSAVRQINAKKKKVS